MIRRPVIEEDLKRQEEDEGSTPNIKMVIYFLKCCKTSSQWQAFINVEFKRYGTQSYECHKYYYCSSALVNLLAYSLKE